jgi:DNA polymerase I
MILIDANAICHQSKHAMLDLSWEEKKVGVIFGFLRQILTLAKLMDSNHFVFAWDSRLSNRALLFPDYKKARRREKSPEEEELDIIAYEQFDILRKEVLPSMGFYNSFMADGFEADDLIADIVRVNSTETIIIISSDEDLYQLLSDRVSLYSTKKKQYYTNHNLWKEFRITPKEWVDVKAIAGCSSDGIPGIPGVGEVTACKYLNRKLAYHLKTYRAIKESTELIDRNKRLVRLPFEGTPSCLMVKNFLSLGNFLDICEKYGFRSFLGKDTLDKWKKFVFLR